MLDFSVVDWSFTEDLHLCLISPFSFFGWGVRGGGGGAEGGGGPILWTKLSAGCVRWAIHETATIWFVAQDLED